MYKRRLFPVGDDISLAFLLSARLFYHHALFNNSSVRRRKRKCIMYIAIVDYSGETFNEDGIKKSRVLQFIVHGVAHESI